MGKKIYRFYCIALLISCILPPFFFFFISSTIEVAFNQYLPPYQFIDKSGKIRGMHIDILNAIALEKDFAIRYVPMTTNNEGLEALQRGDVDILLGTTITDSSQYAFQYTNEVSSSSMCVIAYNSVADTIDDHLENPELIASFEHGTASYSIMRNLGILRFNVVGNQMRVLQLQKEGIVDIAVGVKDSLLYQIYQDGLEDQYSIIHRHIGSISYVMSVKKEDSFLRQALNDGLAKLRTSEEYENIYKRWIVNEYEQSNSVFFKKITLFAVFIFLIFLIYFLFNSNIKKMLKKQVDFKTHELRDANNKLKHQFSQMKIENELRNNIIEFSPGGIILFDSHFNLKLFNKSAENLISNCPLLIDMNVLELRIFGEILKGKIDKTFFNSGSGLIIDTLKICENDRKERIYRYSIHHTKIMGKNDGALMTLEDVTQEEIIKYETFEAEKNKQLNSIVAKIAHEIRNPLTAISTSASIIETKGDSRQFREAFAEYVPREISRINRLVESLIEYARPVKSLNESVDINDVVKSCIYLADTIIKKRKIRIQTDLKEKLIITGNRDRIKQIFYNLILNSVDAMEKKLNSMNPDEQIYLTLNIQAWKEGSWVIICINDEGIGMTKDEILHCNEPFFTTKSTGTGIGLSLVREYVEDNKGLMLIESEKNKYTRIELKFKRSDI